MFSRTKQSALSDRFGGSMGVLDFASNKMAGAIARYSRDDEARFVTEIIGLSHRKSLGVAPSGYLEVACEDALNLTIETAEKMAAERMKQALVVVNARQVNCHRLAVEITLAGHTVLDDDVRLCLKRAIESCTRKDDMLLHAWPTGYILDRRDTVSDPRGLSGERLTVEVTCLTASKSFLHNLSQTIARGDVETRAFLAAPYLASQAVLLEDEKQMGVICFDLGARTTGLSVWQDNALIYAGHVPIGGDHITGDLAKAYALDLQEADRLKIMKGLGGVGDEESLLPRAIIEPRLEEIFELALLKITDAKVDRSKLTRAVMTGGASQLTGLVEFAEKNLGLRARLGKPLNGWGGPSTASSPAFASLMGAVDCLHHDYCSRDSRPAMTGEERDREEAAPMPKRVYGWLRDHF